MGDWNLDHIGQAFADAALDPTAWIKALNVVTAQTNSFGAVLLPIVGAPLPNVPQTESLDKISEVYFRDQWHLRDERNKGLPLLMRNGVFDDLDIVSGDKIKRHPYYQEFIVPLGLKWFGGVRVASGDDVWCLSIQRSDRQEPFSRSEKQKLARLADMLSASAALAKALGFAAAGAALDAFESTGTAVILINRQGEVFRTNQPAEQMLTGDVRIIRKKLTAQDSRATAVFDHALYELLWHRGGPALFPPIVLPRAGQHPLLAYPVKLSSLSASALAECKAAVVLVDPGKRTQPPVAPLRAAFNLTEAEARLAARLASGRALDAVASELGIAKETSRNQLKSIFGKTGTHRQAELVALFSPLLSRSDRNP
jgi:DNA-binding CsgD family transcriptional regulator